MHEPADAFHQVGWPEPLFDEHELDAGIQSLAVFGVEIERGNDDHRDVAPFSVATAAGGVEGLKLAKDLRPTAITLDVMMPDLAGLGNGAPPFRRRKRRRRMTARGTK